MTDTPQRWRALIEDAYGPFRNGVITRPGKFEGEMCYVPYLWDLVLQGAGEWTDDGGDTVIIESADREAFPELEDATEAYLEESEQGFVYCVIK